MVVEIRNRKGCFLEENNCGKIGEISTGWETLRPKGPKGCSLWHNIYNELEYFNKHVRFKVRAGKENRFWEDLWIGDGVFCNKFPLVYEASRTKGCVVARLYESSSDGIKWKFMSRERYFQAILREVASIKSSLESVNIQEGGIDSRLWMIEDNNKLDAYSEKNGVISLSETDAMDFPSEIIWSRLYPYKFNFFLWLLCHEKLMTADKLVRRGMDVDRTCSFCEEEDETSSHLFCECWRIKRIWTYFVEGCDFRWRYNDHIATTIQTWSHDWGISDLTIYGTIFRPQYGGACGRKEMKGSSTTKIII
ncbi:uncharacterized protein LOC113352021 [Papaver somniferum]|uniref:uncharacterized protein LOC113352021 n=1 Tax=Papaver somniferum TaxID=3469 RepID=UPI000E6FF83D|nr:uncharacterized protein LOC113352021 [Papaver somniferum]